MSPLIGITSPPPPLRASILLVALLLAACEFRGETTIQPTGAGAFRTEIGFTPEERQRLEAQAGNAQDFCGVSRAPAGMTIFEEQRGDMTWCIDVAAFHDLDALRGLYGESDGVTINRLEIRDDRLYYNMDIDTTAAESPFSSFSSITWILAVPGTLLHDNATRSTSNAATWELLPRTGIINLAAESTLEPIPVLQQIAVPLLGLALLVFLAVILLRARRRRPVTPP